MGLWQKDGKEHKRKTTTTMTIRTVLSFVNSKIISELKILYAGRIRFTVVCISRYVRAVCDVVIRSRDPVTWYTGEHCRRRSDDDGTTTERQHQHCQQQQQQQRGQTTVYVVLLLQSVTLHTDQGGQSRDSQDAWFMGY